MPASNHIPAAESERTEVRRLSAALALAERDRQLLGFEIHDGVVQDLSAAAMYFEGANRDAQFSAAESQEQFVLGLRLLQGAVAELRRIIRGSAAAEVDSRGLAGALAHLAEKFRAEHGLPVDFAASGELPPLAASTQHLLLRIAQEALYNVWKHAQARNVQLRLTVAGARLELSIADDGVGFDPAQNSTGHFGLESMRARARILAADLKIESRAGQGTRVAVTMPLL